MHILKVIHGYPPRYNAGSEVYSQSICNALRIRHEVSVFTREEDPFRPDFDLRKVKAEQQPAQYFINMPRAKDGYRHARLDAAFSHLLEEIRPDIAHIGHLNHLSTGIVDVLRCKRVPIVFTLHDFWLMCPRGQFLQRNFDGETLYGLCDGQAHTKCALNCYAMHFSGKASDHESDLAYWSEWIARRMVETKDLSEKVDIFIAPSQYLMGRFIHEFGLPPQKLTYLDYGFPLEYLTTSGDKSIQTFTFGYIGTHIPAKGIFQLIEAFSKLSGKATLRIWGRHSPQNTDALKALADTHVRPPLTVEWMGEYVNQNIAEHVFRYCNVIVVPSIWGENSPLVIHEAQACKVPVITADFGGMAEYVTHQKNGLLFRHRDADDLAVQLQWALNHPQEMAALGKVGYLHHPEGRIPDIHSHCEALSDLYQKVIQQYGASTLASHT